MTQKLSPFYDKKVICLFCNNPFKTKKIRSQFQHPTKYDRDFCPVYDNTLHNPLFYFVNVCPECGFSFTDQFNKHFPDETSKEIKTNLCERWKKLTYCKMRTRKQGIDSYKLGIYSAELKNEDPSILAGLCLRLAWLYRQKENREEEERFMNLALSQYKEAYTDSTLIGTFISEMRVLYLLGELSRRLADYTQAVFYFSKVIEHKNQHLEKNIVKLARQQWQLSREESQNQKPIPTP